MKKPWSRAFREKAKHSGAAQPIGTIAFYGPDRSYASKVAVGVSPAAGAPVDVLDRWFDRGIDVRVDPQIRAAVKDFLRRLRYARLSSAMALSAVHTKRA